MFTLRLRLSDTLIRIGTRQALEHAQLVRKLAGLPGNSQSRDAAAGAVATAGVVDDFLLWLGFRLRPATAFPER